MSSTIAIITSNTLEAIGLKHIFETSFSATTHTFASLADFPDSSSYIYDFYVCDALCFVSNLDFFLPRKHKVILISDNETKINGIHCISAHRDESQLIDCLNMLITDNPTKSTESQTELSQRETEVLKLIASGLINKEIADKLGISINTVLTHRKNITAKLGIRSVSGLSFYAMMNGIIAPK